MSRKKPKIPILPDTKPLSAGEILQAKDFPKEIKKKYKKNNLNE